MNNIELRQQLRERKERWQIHQSGWFDAVGMIVPVAAPLVPALLTSTAIIEHYPKVINVNFWLIVAIALITGLVIEMLGVLSIETMFEMRAFNKTMNAGEEPAPFGYAMWAVSFYLILVLSLVLLLKIWHDLALWSLAPLTMLGFVTSWVMVLRKQHSERVYLRDCVQAEQKIMNSLERTVNELRTENKNLMERLAVQSEQNAIVPGVEKVKQPENDTDHRRTIVLDFYRSNPGVPYSQAAETLGLSKTTIYNDVKFWEKRGTIHVNGNGVEVLS
jgi:hypothetical protein